MRILVTGSRDWVDYQTLSRAIVQEQVNLSPLKPGQYDYNDGDWTIVHGDSRGADAMADDFAFVNLYQVERYPANWTGSCRDTCRPDHRRQRWDGADYCPAAGNYRNQDMVDLGADVCIAFFKRNARNAGTWDCVMRAEAAGIKVVRVTDA
jgi:hypothetical protein